MTKTKKFSAQPMLTEAKKRLCGLIQAQQAVSAAVTEQRNMISLIEKNKKVTVKVVS